MSLRREFSISILSPSHYIGRLRSDAAVELMSVPTTMLKLKCGVTLRAFGELQKGKVSSTALARTGHDSSDAVCRQTCSPLTDPPCTAILSGGKDNVGPLTACKEIEVLLVGQFSFGHANIVCLYQDELSNYPATTPHPSPRLQPTKNPPPNPIQQNPTLANG